MIGDISGEAAIGAISGFWKTALASVKGLSKPTVMTRNGRASERQTGSTGTLSRYAARKAHKHPQIEEMSVPKATN